jgi:hypothetical protein
MQRGCVRTLAASANSARERMAGSAIALKADAGCKVAPSGVCAEPDTEASSAAQTKQGVSRMIPHHPADVSRFDNLPRKERFTAAKAAAGFSFWTFMSLLMGAAAATLGGIFGGNQRDEELFGGRRAPGITPRR